MSSAEVYALHCVQAAEEFEQRAAADAEAAEEDEPPLPVKGRAKLAVSRRQLARRADAPPQAQIPFSALPKVRARPLWEARGRIAKLEAHTLGLGSGGREAYVAGS